MLTTMEFNPVAFDWNFVFTIINLLIFYVLIKKFLWQKIMDTMDKRKEIIDKNLKDAEDSKNEANQLKQQYESKIQNVDDESKRLIDEAKNDAKTEYNKIIEQAKSDAQKMQDDARESIAHQCENAKRAAREDIANLAVQMAQKVVGESVNAQTDSKIYDRFLDEGSDE